MLDNIFINATTLSDAWFQTLYKCLEKAKTFKVDWGSFRGQKRLEFDSLMIQIKYPFVIPLIPKLNPILGIPDPVEEDYFEKYLSYFMTDEEKENESYTYGQRLCKCEIKSLGVFSRKEIDIFLEENILKIENERFFLNQIEFIIWNYKNKGYINNQMIFQIGKPSDISLCEPPCLRHIDTKIRDGKLHFFPYFRSWDLYNAFPANLAAIETLKQYCAEQIGVNNGEIVASSKGLHIYDYAFEIANKIKNGK